MERRVISEENKALARGSWEAVSNPDIMGEVYAADLVWHEPEGDVRSIEEAEQKLAKEGPNL